MELYLKGFGSFKNEARIKFRPGLTNITGHNKDHQDSFCSNGAGKSTILNAITWAMYGTTPGGVKKERVINFDCNSAEVKLTFDEGFYIHRVQKTKGEKVEFGWDGKIFNLDVLEAQSRIKQILGLNYQSFCNAFFIGRDNSFVHFLRLNQSQRLKLLEDLVGGTQYANALPLVNKLITTQENEHGLLDHTIFTQEQAFSEKALLQNAKAIKLQELKDRRADAFMKSKKAKEARQNKRAGFEQSSLCLSKEIEQFYKQVDGVKEAIIRYQTHKERLQQKLKDYNDLGDSATCNFCKQPISEEYRSQMGWHRAQITQQLKDTETALSELTAKRAEWVSKINENQRKMRENDEEIAKINKDDSAENSFEYDAAIDILVEDISRITSEMVEIKKKVNMDKLELQEKRLALEYYRFWSTGFGSKGIRKMLIANLRSGINRYAEYWNNEIFKGSYNVELPVDIDTEGLEVVIRKGYNEFEYGQLSLGEAWRVNVVLLLSLASLMKSSYDTPINFLLLDDLFEGLDEVGVEVIYNIFANLAIKDFKYIIITTPRPNFQSGLQIEKQYGESKIISGGK